MVNNGYVRQDIDRHVVDALVALLVEIIVAAFITMPILHTARRIAGGLDGGMIDHRVPVRARTEQEQQHDDKDNDEGDDDTDADDDFLFVLFGLFGGAVLLRHLFFFCHSPSFVFAKHDERTAGCPAWPCARPPEGCGRRRILCPGPHFGIIIPQPPGFCNPFFPKSFPFFQLFFIPFADKNRTFCCILPIFLPLRVPCLPVFRSFLSKRAKNKKTGRKKFLPGGNGRHLFRRAP